MIGRRIKMAMILALLFTSLSVVPLAASVTTQDLGSTTMDNIVNTLMYENSGITIVEGTFSYAGSNNAVGTFGGGYEVFGIEDGIVLSTGDISSIVGPNINGDTTTENGTAGDADLSALVGYATNDASVIEFDFIPENDFVSFQYVFGSEEYLEYVGSSFNDVFAFFVNGTNYALLPNSDVVSINNVNTLANSEYYVDNDPRFSPEVALDTEMDGFTTVLTFLAPVDSGEVNHLKIAVGDTYDSKYDSTVLIKAGSFTSRKSDLSLSKTVDNDTPGRLESIGYTLTVSNAGPDDATGVVVEDILPEGVTFTGHEGDGAYSPLTGLWTVPMIESGGSASITINCIVSQSAGVTNIAEIVESDNYDPDSTPDNGDMSEDDMASVAISPRIADLSLEKGIDVGTCTIGDMVTYTLSLHNAGPSIATGVTVMEDMPSSLEVLSAVGDGTYSTITNIWDVPSIGVGQEAEMTITARVISAITITNTAEVWHSDCFDPDSTPANGVTYEDDYDVVSVSPTIADVALDIDVDDTNPVVGTLITCNVDVNNEGPDVASGVTVSIDIPSGLSFMGSVGIGYNSSTSVWNVGDLATGETKSLGITLLVQDHLPKTIVAEVESMQPGDIDSTPGNGVASEDDFDEEDIVPQYSDLSITSEANDTTPMLGDEVEITITVTNGGPDPTSNVSISHVLSPGLIYVSHAGYGTYDSTDDTWSVGYMDTHDSFSLVIRATVDTEDPLTCSAEVESSYNFDPDSTPGNGNTSEDDFSLVTLVPFAEREYEEENNPFNYFAILMPVVKTNIAKANSIMECLVAHLPEEVPEEIDALMAEIGAHMENAISYSNTIYVNSELEKALTGMREVSMLLESGCWEQFD